MAGICGCDGENSSGENSFDFNANKLACDWRMGGDCGINFIGGFHCSCRPSKAGCIDCLLHSNK